MTVSLSGADLLQSGDPDMVRRIRDVLLLRAHRARTSPADFLEFVMREESTRDPIKVAPHQRVGMDFIMAHDRSVLVWPINTAKTYTLATLTIMRLGQDPHMRGAIVSASEKQAKKVVRLVADTIQHSQELALVFPGLRPSPRKSDEWSQTSITVERPPGIKDPSFAAYCMDSGSILGSRLDWVIVDDLLNEENTRTKEQRDKVVQFFWSTLHGRLEVKRAKIAVINSPWHVHDLVARLSSSQSRRVSDWVGSGWPTLRMDSYGDIHVTDGEEEIRTLKRDPWDSDLLRPASPSPAPGDTACRLVAHDPDPGNEKVLWPERLPREFLEAERRRNHFEWLRNRRCIVRDDETAMCKQGFVDKCLQVAVENGIHDFVTKWDNAEGWFTTMGVDLAVDKGEEHDDTAFFTFAIRPRDGLRIILDIEYGKWDGPTIVAKLIAKAKLFNAVVRVESNACFIPGTPVLTRERGYVPIEDVQVGEHTWTHRARWRPVSRVLRGESEMITHARVAGGLEVSCTPNHWFWLREAGRTPGRTGGYHRPVGDARWVSVGFSDKPAYAAVASPRWPVSRAQLVMKKTRQEPAAVMDVDEEMALVLGLYMAEGCSTRAQVYWTFARHETYLAQLVARVCVRLAPNRSVRVCDNGTTLRVIVCSTRLANVLRAVGKRGSKCLPLAWLGWSLSLRMAILRGWILGDGCLRTNNQRSGWPTRFFSGVSISRNWIMWARSTLLEAGYAPSISRNGSRNGSRTHSVIEGRTVARQPIYEIRLGAVESFQFRQTMTHPAEEAHWPRGSYGASTRARCSVVDVEDHGWSRLRAGPGEWERYDGPVYNLKVEGDESFTVQDYVVHNAQAYIRQFVLQQDVAIPIKAHMTGRAKAHPEHGVATMFVEMANGAWAFPNRPGQDLHPMLARFIAGCLDYAPSKHTDDGLMANYMAREQARAWGALAPSEPGHPSGMAPGLAASLMAR